MLNNDDVGSDDTMKVNTTCLLGPVTFIYGSIPRIPHSFTMFDMIYNFCISFMFFFPIIITFYKNNRCVINKLLTVILNENLGWLVDGA